MSNFKTCTRCHERFGEPLDKFFHKKRNSSDGYQQRCKTCIAVLHKEHYQKRTDYYKEKAWRHNLSYRKRNQEFVLDYLSKHPCIDCGETNALLLEFDHRADKNYNVSQMTTLSLDLLEEEIAKCDVRCCSCHRIKTALQFGWYSQVRPEIFNLIIQTDIDEKEAQIESYERGLKNAERIVKHGRLPDGTKYEGCLDPFKDRTTDEKKIEKLKRQIENLKKLFK